MKIGVIGVGRWGCTLASILQHDANEVKLFGLKSDIAELVRMRWKIPHTDCLMNWGVQVTSCHDGLPECEVVFIAVDGQNLSPCWQQWRYSIKGIVAVAVKSIYTEKGKLILPLDLIKNPSNQVVYFGSAAFPEGLMTGSPAIGTVFSTSGEKAKIVQELFPKELLRVYTSSDINGGQIGSALKNVIALASGITWGLGFDEMTRAAIVSRGLFEIRQFARQKDAHEDTFAAGSSALADCIGTCFSTNSHNLQAGIALAEQISIQEIIDELGTVEGFHTIKIVREIDGALDQMPISTAVAKIALDGVPPRDAMRELLDRPLKSG